MTNPIKAHQPNVDAPEHIPAMQARELPMVTTLSKFDGIGLGHWSAEHNAVYVRHGSYWAVRGDLDVFPIYNVIHDDGRGYMNAVRGLGMFAR